MEGYINRIVDEKEEIDVKIVKLGSLIKGGTFKILSVSEKARIREQFKIMVLYSNILLERIVAAGGEELVKLDTEFIESVENG